MEHKDRFVDELLDSAIAKQRGAEPRPGIEGRILQRVRVAASPRAHSRKRWVVGPVMAAAAALMIAAIYVAHRPHRPAIQAPEAGNTVSAPVPNKTLTANSGTSPKPATAMSGAVPRRTTQRERKPRRRAKAHQWPSQFPSPAPLSPEEKALVQYVRDTPPQVLSTPILKAEFTVHRVEIKPLEITPLEIQ